MLEHLKTAAALIALWGIALWCIVTGYVPHGRDEEDGQ